MVREVGAIAVNDEFQSMWKGARVGRDFHFAAANGVVKMKMFVRIEDIGLQPNVATEPRVEPGSPIPYSILC
jgi:hypothetical protein